MTSRGSTSSSVPKFSSSATSFVLRSLRSFMSDWFRVMRISQVENWESPLKSAKCW
jgi:hypothetical protein